MKKLICKIVTLGRHWWFYGTARCDFTPKVLCSICGHVPSNQWEIYKKKFKGKAKGKATI